jgi:DNA polymerase-3 subunit delta
MKLPLQQLEKHLAKTVAPIYFISTDEILQMQEATDLIRKAALKAGFTERLSLMIDSGMDWEEVLYAEAHSLSLFATQRLIELHLGDIKPNNTSGKVLENYAKNPPADTILVICANKMDSKIEKANWYKAIDKAGITLQIWPIQPNQLPAWIKQRAQKSGLNLTAEAAKMLAEQVEGNLLAAAQEIEKLGLLYLSPDTSNKLINHQDIENAIIDSAHFTIFDLVDSTLSGNKVRSLRILENLKAEDVEPIIILWALTRELRTLAEIAKQAKQGMALSSLFSQFRIWEKRQPSVRRFLQQHSLPACWEFLITAAEIDRIIKGATVSNVWNELQRFTLAIAG